MSWLKLRRISTFTGQFFWQTSILKHKIQLSTFRNRVPTTSTLLLKNKQQKQTMEDKLRGEAKSLVDNIKKLRAELIEKSSNGDGPEFILQGSAEIKMPKDLSQLGPEPKLKRMLKGHFGKVRCFSSFQYYISSFFLVSFLPRPCHCSCG